MIVQPASLGPRSRPRRVLRMIALVVPVVLLGAVVAAGVLGPAPAPPRVAPTALPAVAVTDPTIGPSSAPDAVTVATLFPSTIGGLDVHGVHWTLEARSRGIARGAMLAIGGYLSLDDQPPDCVGAGLGIVVPFCDRTGFLAEGQWSGHAAAEIDLPLFHLHPQIPYGVRVPYLASIAGGLDGGALPVVVLARFDDARAEPCLPEGRHCGQELVVERIAWVDGDSFPRTVTVDPAVSGGPPGDEIERQGAEAMGTLPPDGYPLLAVLVRPSTLAEIDPVAAATVPKGGLAADGAAWYVRGLHATGDPAQVDWLVVDEDGERVLAQGSIPLRTASGLGAPER